LPSKHVELGLPEAAPLAPFGRKSSKRKQLRTRRM
jgi:hypothetical protein